MITYKYSSKLKFMLIALLGTIKSSEYVILAYIVGTLTNIATNHQLGRLPGFIAFVICTFVLLLLAELIYNSLRAAKSGVSMSFFEEKFCRACWGGRKMKTGNHLVF